jgi:protein-S-isoprenylcysteine O-methyltransferase Ste14
MAEMSSQTFFHCARTRFFVCEYNLHLSLRFLTVKMYIIRCPSTHHSAGRMSGEYISREREFPRWKAIIISLISWVIGLPLVHGILPWILSLLTPSLGWNGNQPSMWNLLGLVPILIAITILLSVMYLHITHTPLTVKLEPVPTYLLTQGPYKFSRNPMYLSELLLWLGWSVIFGSILLLICSFILWVLMNYVAIPKEERALEERFGDLYREYKNKVSRWIKLI